MNHTAIRGTPRRLAMALGVYALVAGTLSFLGWAGDVRRLTDWIDNGISIQPNTAIGAMAAGAALVLLPRFGRISAPFALLAGLIGTATLFEHLTGTDLGIDTLLTFGRNWGAGATVAPGRMGLPGSTSWMLLGTGLLLALGGTGSRQQAAALALAGTVIGALSLIGYLFGADPLYSLPRLTAVAGQTSTLILAVSLGLLAALPDRQPTRMLLEDSAAGLLIRRALPLVVALPLVLGLLVLRGREAELYDRGMAFALLVLALVLLTSLGLWWSAAAVAAHERALAAANHAVRESEQRFRRLADAMPQIVFTAEPDGRIGFTNQQWKDYTGGQGDEPADLAAPVHPDDRSMLRERWERARASGEEFGAEYRLKRAADGVYRWFLTRALPVRDERGRIAQWYGTSTDIDDQKRAELMLQESEQRFRAFADAAPAILWVTEPDGFCSFLSRGWYEFTGQTERDALGLGWIQALHPNDRANARNRFVAAIGSREPFTLEHRLGRHDGEYRWALFAGRPRFSPDGEFVGYSGSVIDIHDRRRAEEQLRQAAKMEAIGRLAGGIAHDFNNQLSAVSGFAAFAARDPGLSARARHDLHEVLKSADRMAGLTRQLLAFSRQQVLQPETLQLNAAVVDASSLLQRLIAADIEMRIDLTAEPSWVRVDRAQLLQVLMNLCINARDAMPGGGRLGIRTDRREDGRYVVLSVTDSGAGILPEHLPHIFEPFFTTKDVGEGTGLGLATVHGIISQSRGRIEVRSEPGRGTTFTVLLPAVAEPAVTPELGQRAGDSVPSSARVLVVDDEEVVCAIVTRTLESEGYQVLQAQDGQGALEQLGRNPDAVDVVLSDVVMPVLGGGDFGARLAAEYPDLPVIWMSGYPRDRAFGDGQNAGAQPFLQKPVPTDVLVKTVQDVLARRPRISRQQPSCTPAPPPPAG
jgi:two-component system, cell cycle sensor histidine kinase and response regulator CckA